MPSRRPALPLWGAVLVAAVAGFVLDLAFPSVGIWPLAYVAVALSLGSLVGRSAGGALLVGLIFGAAFYFPHISWASSFLGDHPLSWVPWVALAGVESVFMGVGAIPIALAIRWSDAWTGRARMLGAPMLVAGLWTARELVMGSWPYGGFAWGRIGMSQAEAPTAQVASWLGVSGLTFLVVLVSAMALQLVRRLLRARRGEGRGVRVLSVAPLAVLGAAMLLVPQFPTTPVGSITVGAVQGNGPAAYLDPRDRLEVARAQLEASDPLVGAGVDVALWPEGGVDADPLADADAATLLDIAATSIGAPLIMNAASVKGDDVYNMSMVWEPGGPTQTHAKRHPVPFGEYVPDRELFEALAPSLIGMIQREYTPGDDPPLFIAGGARIGLAICFDVISDSLIREGAVDGAQVYMLQTNNADFRGTDENLQQLAFARMRAIETGRSVVNLSTVGTSQVIAPDGTTLQQLGVDEAGAMIADVELRDGLTAGLVVGPWLQALLLWGSAAALVIVAVRRRLVAKPAPDAPADPAD